MRITGGKYRGRTIQCPPGVIRPAMDRMRESLFSILGPIDGSSFLDLFSGSGLVGLEAASRGAYPVHLVEMDRKKKKTMQRNIQFVDTEIELFMMSVQAFMRRTGRFYDIVYADPPFPMKEKQKIIDQADASDIVAPGGLFLIHYPSEDKLADASSGGSLVYFDERKYGRSLLRFYRREKTYDETDTGTS